MSELGPLSPVPPGWGETTQPSRFRQFLRGLGELLQTLLIAGLLFLVVNVITARIRVEGNSMFPSLNDGQFVVVNRLAYVLGEPERGDVIVFHPPHDPPRRFIKRVIGTAGDVVQVQGGDLYVNGILLDEPYVAAAPRYSGEWKVGADQVFVLGDNRNNSNDSQNWGALPLDQVIGRAVLVYWPPADIGPIPHYTLATAAPD
jgi:signal peptidase I